MIPAAVVAATACGSSTLPAARILSIDAPSQSTDQHIGYIGEDLVLTVVGEGFSDVIVPNVGDPDASKIDRAQMFIQLQGAAAPVLVVGTFLSPTLFEGTLPVDPGVYDLTLVNGDGESATITDAFQMGYRATTLMVLTTDAEPAPGNANRVTFEMRLVAANGVDPGIWKQPLNLEPAWIGSSATFLLDAPPASWEVAPGETFTPQQMVVHDSRNVAIVVSIDIDPGIALSPPSTQINFNPGTPVRARLLPAEELVATDNFANTTFQVEDQWQNPCEVHALYDADFGVSICAGASVNPTTVNVPANVGSVPVQVLCASTNDTFVTFSENTATGYANGGLTVIQFN